MLTRKEGVDAELARGSGERPAGELGAEASVGCCATSAGDSTSPGLSSSSGDGDGLHGAHPRRAARLTLSIWVFPSGAVVSASREGEGELLRIPAEHLRSPQVHLSSFDYSFEPSKCSF